MHTKPALYVCPPCKAQSWHDVPMKGTAHARACVACAQPMVRTSPHFVRALFARHEREQTARPAAPAVE